VAVAVWPTVDHLYMRQSVTPSESERLTRLRHDFGIKCSVLATALAANRATGALHIHKCRSKRIGPSVIVRMLQILSILTDGRGSIK
jgi:hypothetical protein